MNNYIIYGLRLSTGGYRYIGQTSKGLAARLRQHARDSLVFDRPVNRWIRKHGSENILADVLEYGPDKDYLNYAERYWIKELRELGLDLLNMTDGGGGTSGYRRKPTRLGMKNSEEHNDKVRQYQISDQNTWRGSTHKEETILNMSDIRSKYWTPDRRAIMSEKMSGRIRTPEHSASLSAAKKGKPSRAMHKRWHLNRNMYSPNCVFCPTNNKATP